MAEGFPAAAAAAAPGIIGLPAKSSPAKGEYLKGKKDYFLQEEICLFPPRKSMRINFEYLNSKTPSACQPTYNKSVKNFVKTISCSRGGCETAAVV